VHVGSTVPASGPAQIAIVDLDEVAFHLRADDGVDRAALLGVLAVDSVRGDLI
jgi:hypothetical protein